MHARDMEVDHKQPKSEGGTDEYSNLRASCRPCNRHLAGAATGSNKRYNSREW